MWSSSQSFSVSVPPHLLQVVLKNSGLNETNLTDYLPLVRVGVVVTDWGYLALVVLLLPLLEHSQVVVVLLVLLVLQPECLMGDLVLVVPQ